MGIRDPDDNHWETKWQPPGPRSGAGDKIYLGLSPERGWGSGGSGATGTWQAGTRREGEVFEGAGHRGGGPGYGPARDFQPRGRLSVSPGWVFPGLAVLGRRIGVAGLPLITGGPGRGENGLRNLQEDPSPECDPFCRSRVPSSFRSSGGRSPGHPGGRRRSSSPGPSPEFPPTGLC